MQSLADVCASELQRMLSVLLQNGIGIVSHAKLQFRKLKKNSRRWIIVYLNAVCQFCNLLEPQVCISTYLFQVLLLQ